MDYYKYEIHLAIPDQYDFVLAHLSILDFESFEEKTNRIDAYIPVTQETVYLEQKLLALKEQFRFDFQKKLVKEQNWNAVWESNFSPMNVNDFCYVYAPFHQPNPHATFNLLIEPKMAFGTGHHATTFMMIELMAGLTFKNKQVFDYGCGTGILAILASMMEATTIDAIDIDTWAVENSMENAIANRCQNIKIQLGDLQLIHHSEYDVILANINRNVLLSSLPKLRSLLKPGGDLLLSGILVDDLPLITEEAKRLALNTIEQKRKQDWTALHLKK